LPEGFYPEDVDPNSPVVVEPLGVESEYIDASADHKGIVTVELDFWWENTCVALADPNITDLIYDDTLEIALVGQLTTGQYFCATDLVKVMMPK